VNRSIEISVIDNAADLAALEPEWWALWHRCPSATPFQSPCWLIPWWRAFAPGELHVVAMRHERRLAGLAPLYIEDESLGRRILPLGISISDYLDLLFEPGIADDLCRSLLLHLESVTWEACELTELPPEAVASRLPCPCRCEEEVATCSIAPVLTLPVAARLEQLLSHRKKRALRTARNRAERRGPVEFPRVDLATAGDAIQLLIRLHGARWESRGEPGVLADPRLARFHTEAIAGLIAAGLGRLHVLTIGGAAAAVYLGFLCRERGYGYLTGFDPEFSYESPGVLLLAHAIEQAICDGAREFHFLRGGEGYKYEWGAIDRANTCRVFRRREAYACAS
jgi:CelD/BcsL family acetyltransferase involved in cellulose biosynthesis